MTYFLYESSLGFALFKLNKLDKLSLEDPKIQKSLTNFQETKKIISLEGTHFFHGHNVAWNTIEQLKNNEIPETLSEFLKTYLPSKKRKSLEIAVQDKNLASLLNKKFKYKCVSGDLYNEIFRGVRCHLSKFLSGSSEEERVDDQKVTQANLGLGHALARNNIKFDEKKNDKAVINSFSLLDQMEKNLNTFVMRIKESYGWHFPELVKIVSDNETYVKLVKFIGNKENLKNVNLEEISEIVKDGELVNKILERYKSSMGNDLNEIDEESLTTFADYILNHYNYKRDLQSYLKAEMTKIAPNLTSLLGESIGAKLLTHAGGLNNLSKLPSSTIQILGAEKALFRAIKKKGDTPKYGLLFNSTFISRADTKNKGKISRMLANKCALASRLDNFLVKPTQRFGERFRDQLNERIDNPDNKDLGKNNIELMEGLVEEMTESGEYVNELKKLKSE